MDTTKKVALVLAFNNYRELQSKFAVHLLNMEEDERKRRMAMISTVLRSRQQIILKTGTEWEIMLNWNDDTFARHLRIAKHQFEYLLTKLQENGLHSEHTQGRTPVPDTKKLLVFLWYMANQNSFREISDKFDVSQAAAHGIIRQVLTIMSGIGNTFMSWPNACEKAASAAAFHRSCGLDGVIGAIDGRGGDYNRKAYYSVLLQGIVDDRARFIDIFAGPPGRVHDARMLRPSTFYTQWEEKMGEHCLLGDGVYIGQDFPFIRTPKRDNGALTVEDHQHNLTISRGRVIVEQAFGRMKCKWRRLRDIQNSRIDTVVMIIMSACFLHNMCIAASDICAEHPNGCPRQEDHNEYSFSGLKERNKIAAGSTTPNWSCPFHIQMYIHTVLSPVAAGLAFHPTYWSCIHAFSCPLDQTPHPPLLPLLIKYGLITTFCLAAL